MIKNTKKVLLSLFLVLGLNSDLLSVDLGFSRLQGLSGASLRSNLCAGVGFYAANQGLRLDFKKSLLFGAFVGATVIVVDKQIEDESASNITFGVVGGGSAGALYSKFSGSPFFPSVLTGAGVGLLGSLTQEFFKFKKDQSKRLENLATEAQVKNLQNSVDQRPNTEQVQDLLAEAVAGLATKDDLAKAVTGLATEKKVEKCLAILQKFEKLMLNGLAQKQVGESSQAALGQGFSFAIKWQDQSFQRMSSVKSSAASKIFKS